MPISALHKIHSVQIGPSTIIGANTQHGLELNTEFMKDTPSSDVFNKWLSIRSQKPRVTFTSKALATILGTYSIPYVDIGNQEGGLKMFAAKYLTNAHGPAAGSVHRQFLAVDGVLSMARLSCQHQDDATMDLAADLRSDGTNQILTAADNVALPAITDTERFSLGPVTVGGIELEQVTSIDIEFGVTAEPRDARSEIHPTFVDVMLIQPMITIRTTEIDKFVLDGGMNDALLGLAGAHTDTEVWLRRRIAGGDFYADDQAQHIQLTAAGTVHFPTPHSASTGDGSEAEIRIETKHDGTNFPLKWLTGQAIDPP